MSTADVMDEAVNHSSVNTSECDGDVFRQSVVVPDWVGNLETSNTETPWTDVTSPGPTDKALKPEPKGPKPEIIENVIDNTIVLESYASPNITGTIDASNVEEVIVGSSNPFDDDIDETVDENPPIVVAVVETMVIGSDNPFDDNYVEPIPVPVVNNTRSANPFDSNYDESYANSIVTKHPPHQPVSAQRSSTTGSSISSTVINTGIFNNKNIHDMNTLISYGFDPEKAATGYKHCGNNISKAYQLLYNKIVNIEVSDNRDMHCWWRTPFSSRILSWMPGESNDTVFIMTIVHHIEDTTWTIEKTGSEFDQLNNSLKVPGYKAFPNGMEFPYPQASYSSVFFGISEEERIERMVKLGKWFKEITLSPIMMLQSNVRLYIHDFLAMDKHLVNKKTTKMKG